MRQSEVNSVYEATTKIYKIINPSDFQCFDRTYNAFVSYDRERRLF